MATTKRIMRQFAIREISAVDRPAQAHAKALIMKRDGIPSAPDSPSNSKEQQMHYENIDRGALALFALEGAAEALRKSQPHLTTEQAFAKAYADPANRMAARTERQASRERIAGYSVARTEPEIVDPYDDAEVKRLIEEERRRNPFLTNEQLFARVYASPEMSRHRAVFREAMAAARSAGSNVRVEVAKRDDALDAIKAKAKELRKAQPDLTQEQAFAKVYKLHPDLAARERGAARAALHAV